MTPILPPSRVDELNEQLRKAVAAWNTDMSGEPAPRQRAGWSMWRLVDIAVAALALSFLVPAAIILAPDFGHAYVCAWQEAFGAGNCFKPDFLRNYEKHTGRLPKSDLPPADKTTPLQRGTP